LKNIPEKPHPRIPMPGDLFGDARRNSLGVDLGDSASLRALARDMKDATRPWRAEPVIGGAVRSDAPGGPEKAVIDPAFTARSPGLVVEATADDVAEATGIAVRAAFEWDSVAAGDRATCLEKAADMMEESRAELMALSVREAGKTIPDAVAEVREAVDFCRYYAAQARKDFSRPERMPGPTGESNQVALHGRGVFACISPWNFPLAIFTGQVTAALAAGNAVVAKPAAQTPLIAARAVDILHRAGVPGDVLHFLPGGGTNVGAPLVADPGISGVSFTGSAETAHTINRALAERSGPIVPLIAETGGQNAMIVDSTALPEQVVDDVVTSAFRSAGQRCSALRVLFLQDDVSERVIRMLTGAMAELTVGDPALLATDVGPVIDGDAQEMLENHARRMDREGTLLARTPLTDSSAEGTFFAPAAYLIERLDLLEGEVFGPILHVIRYAADRLDGVIEAVNGTGFGLTLGIHSRVGKTQRYIQQRVKAGNAYVNRSMIGAVVGVQPFGGEGLSGTGPKAGGPRYLHRFAVERTLSVDTTAAGGNAALMSLKE
ncbi:MAG: bifunctional proline dehydrogenase/L-glutamate gamma-semialdehyde dehydrogenase PutA, partial [Rhodospirillales bacterium]